MQKLRGQAETVASSVRTAHALPWWVNCFSRGTPANQGCGISRKVDAAEHRGRRLNEVTKVRQLVAGPTEVGVLRRRQLARIDIACCCKSHPAPPCERSSRLFSKSKAKVSDKVLVQRCRLSEATSRVK